MCKDIESNDELAKVYNKIAAFRYQLSNEHVLICSILCEIQSDLLKQFPMGLDDERLVSCKNL